MPPTLKLKKVIVKWHYNSILVFLNVYKIDKQAGLSQEERSAAEIKFKEVGEAYTVLSDEKKKRMFDSGMDINGMSDMSDGFGGGGFGGGVPMDDILRAFMSQQQGSRGSPHGGFHFDFNNGGY
jgi:DnaJ family protein C protein 7